MRTRFARLLRPATLIMLPLLLGGCPPDAASSTTALQNVQTFIVDLARQVLTALSL